MVAFKTKQNKKNNTHTYSSSKNKKKNLLFSLTNIFSNWYFFFPCKLFIKLYVLKHYNIYHNYKTL